MGDYPFLGPTDRVAGTDGNLRTNIPDSVEPGIDFIWNANNRMVGGTQLAKLGDGGYDRGARARQIRDDLLRLRSATPKDMLDIQLDDRAVFLERWHSQLLSALSSPGALPNRERLEFRRRLEDWSGRAESGVYRLSISQEYREEVARRSI